MSQSVAVIIVNHNAGRLLTRSLESLRKQTFKPQQIYVVDDASRDGSCDRMPADFPEVTLIRLEQHRLRSTGKCREWEIGQHSIRESKKLASESHRIQDQSGSPVPGLACQTRT